MVTQREQDMMMMLDFVSYVFVSDVVWLELEAGVNPGWGQEGWSKEEKEKEMREEEEGEISPPKSNSWIRHWLEEHDTKDERSGTF